MAYDDEPPHLYQIIETGEIVLIHYEWYDVTGWTCIKINDLLAIQDTHLFVAYKKILKAWKVDKLDVRLLSIYSFPNLEEYLEH